MSEYNYGPLEHELAGGFDEKKSEFDQVFEDLESPDYPATCDQCGEVGTNASIDAHICNEPPAPRAGECGKWRAFKHYVLNAAGLLVAEAQTEEKAELITADHNQHATLVEQRERLVDFVRPFAEKGCVCMGDTCKQRRLPKFCTPCRASELLTTIEREGEA